MLFTISGTQYSTTTDKLLAHFIEYHDLPITISDSLLDLLHNPSFKLEDLTFKRTTDINKAVREYGAKVVSARSVEHTVAPRAANIVMNLTLDFLEG